MDPKEDIFREKPDPVRERQWSHGDDGFGRACDQYDKPVFVPPGQVPPPCPGDDSKGVRRGPCENEHWNAGPHVIRDRKSGKILHEEK